MRFCKKNPKICIAHISSLFIILFNYYLQMEKEQAYKVCKELNRDKDSLISTGYTEFEVVPFVEQ